jgi:hypothetical protein
MTEEATTPTGVTNQGQTIRAMTPGEIAVGLTFNPSGDEKVNKIKILMAEVFDIVEQSVDVNREDRFPYDVARQRKMRDAALSEIITAQMWAVKVVTLK